MVRLKECDMSRLPAGDLAGRFRGSGLESMRKRTCT